MAPPEADQATADIARAALDLWDLSGSELEHVSVSENTTFRVRSAAGDHLVLRVHRPGYHTLPELESEHLWVAALNEAGIGVPVVRLSRHGRSHHEVEDPASGLKRVVGMAEWVEGETVRALLEQGAPDVSLEATFRKLGRIAAAIHNQAVGWESPEGFQRHALDAAGFMGESPWWGPFWDLPQLSSAQRQHLMTIRHRLHELLEELRSVPGTYSMIHADLHLGNLITHGEGLHIIDFDDAGFGFHQYELAVALTDHAGDSDDDRFERALFEGYLSVRDISDETLAQVKVFRFIRVLASIGWLAQRPELGLEERLVEVIELAFRWADELGYG